MVPAGIGVERVVGIEADEELEPDVEAWGSPGLLNDIALTRMEILCPRLELKDACAFFLVLGIDYVRRG